MRAILLVALSVVTACGPTDSRGEVVDRCETAIGTVSGEFPLDCARVRDNVRIAREWLTVEVIPPAEFDLAFVNVPIHVRAGATWSEHGTEVNGRFEWGSGIDVGRTSEHLAHEMLHLWDSMHGAPGTAAHLHWDVNGYDEASYNYWRRCHIGLLRDQE
jgi:hypothetical protein